MGSLEGQSRVASWTTAVALLSIFALALFVRTYWALEGARAEDGHFLLSGGSDGYYIKRAVDYLQENGWKTLVRDPLLNYPLGSVNPNPPLFVSSIAILGWILSPLWGGNLELSTWWATVLSPALWGALTIFPVYFFARELFGRQAGILAAFFLALAPQHIGQTTLGDARHYAIALFFITLTAFFYLKAVHEVSGRTTPWVSSWKDPSSIARGIGLLLRERSRLMGWALLAGTALGAEALMWKGFPYLVGIIFLYAIAEMLIDHWKNRDSLGLFLVTLVSLGLGMILASPYYIEAGILTFLLPGIFLWVGFLVAGLVLVPTRDLPTILVLPAFLFFAGVGVLVAFYAIPAVSVTLLYAVLYFKQNTLYQTIAEAHPADFNSLAFSPGPGTFFLALGGWVLALPHIRKEPQKAHLLAWIWFLIALYMATSATRFLFNATPIFAIYAGWALARFLSFLDFSRLVREIRSAGAFWTGVRRGFSPWHAVGPVLVVLLLVIPNVVLAVDAGTPPEWEIRAEREHPSWKSFIDKRLRAFGPSFLPDYWDESLRWLDEYDRAIPDPAQRPAFLAWWDYGHWAIYVGRHPTVADNFQNGYVFAAHFLLSQNETEALQLLSARLLDPRAGVSSDRARAILEEVGVPSNESSQVLDDLLSFRFVPSLNLSQSNELYRKVMKESGKEIRYVAADIRMLPYDDPTTPHIELTSIFYAPVVLAGKKPEDFVSLRYETPLGEITPDQLQRYLRNPNVRSSDVQPTGQKYLYTEAFFNTMFYRTYVGTPTAPTGPLSDGSRLAQGLNAPYPAYGLQHFRLVHANDQMKLLEYYEGARIRGRVVDEKTKEGIAGATVVVYDDAGEITELSFPSSFRGTIPASSLNVPHDFVQTDSNGTFEVIAPFSLGGNITLRAFEGGTVLGEVAFPISRQEARAGALFDNTTIVVKRSKVLGTVFYDVNGNGTYDPTIDRPVADATVVVGDSSAITDSAGRYELSSVSAGTHRVEVFSPSFRVNSSSSSLTVSPGKTIVHNISVDFVPSIVSGTVWADLNGDGIRQSHEGVEGVTVSFTPDPSTSARRPSLLPTTNETGSYSVSLVPGRYDVSASWTSPDGERWSSSVVLEVPEGGAQRTLDLELRPQG